MKLLPRLNYQVWKWKVLKKRRTYYFYTLNVFLVFFWLAITLEFNDGSLRATKLRPLYSAPLILVIFHALIFLTGLSEPLMKLCVEKFRFPYLVSCSLFAGLAFALVTACIRFVERDTHALSATVLYLVACKLSFIIFHHMGLMDIVIRGFKFIVALSWIAFFVFSVSFYFFPLSHLSIHSSFRCHHRKSSGHMC